MQMSWVLRLLQGVEPRSANPAPASMGSWHSSVLIQHSLEARTLVSWGPRVQLRLPTPLEKNVQARSSPFCLAEAWLGTASDANGAAKVPFTQETNPESNPIVPPDLLPCLSSSAPQPCPCFFLQKYTPPTWCLQPSAQ